MEKEWVADVIEGAQVVRVEATVIFEAYALTDVREYRAGLSVEARVAEEIANALGYHAVHGTDVNPGDSLIAMTGEPDFAADVRNISVTVITKIPVDPEHVMERAQSVTGSR